MIKYRTKKGIEYSTIGDSISLGSFTTQERDNIYQPQEGEFIYNSSKQSIEVYISGLWKELGNYNDLTNKLTDEDIKTKYENNPDTNEFTNSEKTKLGNQSGTNTGDQDISNFETTTQLNTRDTNNRNTDNHTDGITSFVLTQTLKDNYDNAYSHSEITDANPHLTDDSQVEETIDYVLIFNNAIS